MFVFIAGRHSSIIPSGVFGGMHLTCARLAAVDMVPLLPE